MKKGGADNISGRRVEKGMEVSCCQRPPAGMIPLAAANLTGNSPVVRSCWTAWPTACYNGLYN